MVLALRQVSVSVGGRCIVQNADIHVRKGDFVGLVGLNGTGKSSLLKAVYGINNYTGDIFLAGENIRSLSLKETARKMAVLVQENSAEFDFKVQDIVMLGRLPYKKLLFEDTAEDFAIVRQALKYVGMESFAGRYFSSLSGGEKQRVLIARILAQQTDFLILDEPTNHLDIKNQFQFFEMVKGLGITVFAVLHDLNLAAKFCDYIYVLNGGRVYAAGRPQEVFSEAMLRDVFRMRARVYNVGDGKVHIEYLGTADAEGTFAAPAFS